MKKTKIKQRKQRLASKTVFFRLFASTPWGTQAVPITANLIRSQLTCHEVVPCRPMGLKLPRQPQPAAAAPHQQAGCAAVQASVGCTRQVLLACTVAKVQEEVVLLQG
jgi:hypothetical protein